MRKVMLLLLVCLPAIAGCPRGITVGQVTAVIVAGTVVLHFVERAYDVDRARLRRDKAQLELELLKDGSRKTEIFQLTEEQAAAIAEKGYYILRKPDGPEQKVLVEVD